MKTELHNVLQDLGFKKTSEYDPTATHQLPDTTSVYTQIRHVPTPVSIDMLGKE